MAGALVDGPVEGLAEERALALPSDHRRVQPARHDLRVRAHVEQPPRLQRRCLTLRVQRAGELGRDCTR